MQYDAEAEACYLELSRRPLARTVHLDDGVMVDVDEAGEPVGVESLWSRYDIPVEAMKLVVERFLPLACSFSGKHCLPLEHGASGTISSSPDAYRCFRQPINGGQESARGRAMFAS